jgi:hypothetical protein
MTQGERANRMHAEPLTNVRQLRRAVAKPGGRRMRANTPARIKVGVSRISCLVTDVSSSGACLSVDGPLDENARLWLVMDNKPPISAKAAWRKRNRIGLSFDKDQDWVHRIHKDRFDPSAWLEESSSPNML